MTLWRHHRSTAVAALLCCSTGGALGQQGRVPVTPADLLAALQRSGVASQGAVVQMPPGLMAQGSAVNLRVQQATRPQAQQLRLRVECQPAASCMPFLASVIFPTAAEAEGAMHGLGESVPTPGATGRTEQARINAGHRTVLLLEGGHTRITLPVIAVDTGRFGEEIRVTSLDHRQTFRGVVAAGDVVSGVLP